LNYSTLDYGNPNTVSNPGWENTKGAPRFAVTIKPEKWLSIYGLYTVHKDPTQYNDVWTIVGEPVPTSVVPNPQAIEFYQPGGKTIEGGIKASLLNGNLTASLAVFHSLDTGTIVASENATYTQPDGTVTGYERNLVTGNNEHGVELQVTGKVTDRLIFDASYALSHGTTPINGGLIDQIDPPTSYAFHGKYDFGDLQGNGFFVTAGCMFYSPYWFKENFSTNEVNIATGKTGDLVWLYWNSWQYTVDAGIGYRWDHGRQKLYLSCNNLTNQFVEFGGSFDGNTSTLPFRQAWLTYSIAFR
jgi:outer membrane receptor for monomeric catechols